MRLQLASEKTRSCESVTSCWQAPHDPRTSGPFSTTTVFLSAEVAGFCISALIPADLLFGICTVPDLKEFAGGAESGVGVLVFFSTSNAALLLAAAFDTLMGIWIVPDLELVLDELELESDENVVTFS
jgi:hypothetical protein